MSLRRAVTPIRLRKETTEVQVKRGGAKTDTIGAVRVIQSVDSLVSRLPYITKEEKDCNNVLAKIKDIIESVSRFQGSLQFYYDEQQKASPGVDPKTIPEIQAFLLQQMKRIVHPIETDKVNSTGKKKTFTVLSRFVNALTTLKSKKVIDYEDKLLARNTDTSFNFSKNTGFEQTLENFNNFLKSIHCPDKPSPYVSITTDIKPLIETFDTTLADTLESLGDFDTPSDVLRWFVENDRQNYFIYLYGVGKILKTKETMLQKLSDSLVEQISRTNSDYESGIQQIESVIPPLPPSDANFEKKVKMIDEIVETTNKSYTSQFNELLQKKIRYDEAIEKLRKRRAYLVYQMNTEDQGFSEIVYTDNEEEKKKNKGKIMARVNDLYDYYRGVRYKDIRKLVFSFVVICAYNPEIIEKSFILNTSITGPAGSGKTTMARKLAIWFTTVGFLTNDEFLENDDLSYREVGAPQLIAQYVGQTAPLTQGVLYSSLEQCLFIDEAYSVAGCAFDPTGKVIPNPYGDEFIAVLLPFMANHQGIGNIIVAGYKNLMESCFFDRNEGLPRRFPTKIDLPLYTTDELYDMFLNFNIIRRQVASVKGKELQEQFRRAKQIIYIGMKPAFLLFHFDTSFSAFEILRKYLLLYAVRKQQFESGGYRKSVPTYSYTILNHVLNNVISSPLRRNIIRYYFYKEVFGFEQQNLSWFPAQAGEMGLVADMVNRKIEVVMNEQKKRNIRQGYITIEQETDVFDTYFESKPVRLVYFKESKDSPVYVEVIKRGYEYEKQKFQDKIANVLINPVLTALAEFKKPKEVEITHSKEEVLEKRLAYLGKNSRSSTPNPESPTPSESVPAKSESVPAKSEPAPVKTEAAAPTKSKLTIPSLEDMWKLLFNDGTTILTLCIQEYIQIAEKVIPELLKIPENKFPVNMLKTDVYNEKTLVDFYKAAPTKTETGLYKSEFSSFNKIMSNYIPKGSKKITLQNPMIFKYLPSEKITQDSLWEDFAFKNK